MVLNPRISFCNTFPGVTDRTSSKLAATDVSELQVHLRQGSRGASSSIGWSRTCRVAQVYEGGQLPSLD
jgi:hypothetical protein